MPYGMTNSQWQHRYQNGNENPVIQTTYCPYCSVGADSTCVTAKGNHTYDVHLGRILRHIKQGSAHHTPDGQPL